MKSITGLSPLLGRKEVKELPNILWDNENIESAVQGMYDNGNGLLVATDRRLIFVNKGRIYGLKVEDFPYDKISSIQYSTGLILGEITIFSSGNKSIMKNILKSSTREFGEFVRNKVSGLKEEKSETTSKSDNTQGNYSSNDDEVLKSLERLAVLKDKGILTDQEFLEQKARILNHI
jgi:hypothetical protein